MKLSAAERTVPLFSEPKKAKKPKKTKAAAELELPPAVREQYRRRALALAVGIPAMPTGEIGNRRSEPPKRGEREGE